MHKVHGMLLVRNEASRRINGRFIFEEVLTTLYNLCDTLTIIDDNSTDNTCEYIQEKTKNDFGSVELIKNETQKWNTNEVSVRKQLFDKTISKAENNDWIVCLDADELILSGFTPYLKYLFDSLSTQIDAIGFKLHDMWSNTHYRYDNFWVAHLNNWIFAIRYNKDKQYIWNEKTLHCGRFPANGAERMLPTQIPVQHFGWASEEDRKRKYERYMTIDPHGINGILAQYKSILDTNPNLVEFGRCCIND